MYSNYPELKKKTPPEKVNDLVYTSKTEVFVGKCLMVWRYIKNKNSRKLGKINNNLNCVKYICLLKDNLYQAWKKVKFFIATKPYGAHYMQYNRVWLIKVLLN